MSHSPTPLRIRHKEQGAAIGTRRVEPNRLLVERELSGPTIEDERLVELALEDRRTFRLLYARYADRLYWYALARTGSAAIADDVVSETMLAALENLERFDRRRGTFASWLFAIGHRKLIDEQRHHRRVWRYITGRGARAGLTEEQDALEQVIHREDASQVYAAIKRLGAPDQEVLALRYSAGLTSVEIGDVLGISPAAARKRLSRARDRLERLLTEGGFSR